MRGVDQIVVLHLLENILKTEKYNKTLMPVGFNFLSTIKAQSIIFNYSKDSEKYK